MILIMNLACNENNYEKVIVITHNIEYTMYIIKIMINSFNLS